MTGTRPHVSSSRARPPMSAWHSARSIWASRTSWRSFLPQPSHFLKRWRNWATVTPSNASARQSRCISRCMSQTHAQTTASIAVSTTTTRLHVWLSQWSRWRPNVKPSENSDRSRTCWLYPASFRRSTVSIILNRCYVCAVRISTISPSKSCRWKARATPVWSKAD